MDLPPATQPVPASLPQPQSRGSSKKILFLVFVLTLALGGAAVFTATRLRKPETIRETPTKAAEKGTVGTCVLPQDCVDNKGIGEGCCVSATCKEGVCSGWREDTYCQVKHGNSADWSCNESCQCVNEPGPWGGSTEICCTGETPNLTPTDPNACSKLYLEQTARGFRLKLNKGTMADPKVCQCDERMSACEECQNTDYLEDDDCGTWQGDANVTYCDQTKYMSVVYTSPRECETPDLLSCSSVTPTQVTSTPGGTVSFTANASGGTAPISFDWTSTGGTLTPSNASRSLISFVVPASATTGTTYSITATAKDGTGKTATSNACQAVVTVSLEEDENPVCLSLTAEPTSGSAPTTVSFSVSASDPSSAISAYKFTFGDGNTEEKASPVTTHTYSVNGIYTAKVNLKYDSSFTGDTAVCSKTITLSTEDAKTHTVCTTDNRCLSVSGSGVSECEVDADCQVGVGSPLVPETGRGGQALLIFGLSLVAVIGGMLGLKKIDPLFEEFEKRATK